MVYDVTTAEGLGDLAWCELAEETVVPITAVLKAGRGLADEPIKWVGTLPSAAEVLSALDREE